MLSFVYCPFYSSYHYYHCIFQSYRHQDLSYIHSQISKCYASHRIKHLVLTHCSSFGTGNGSLPSTGVKDHNLIVLGQAIWFQYDQHSPGAVALEIINSILSFFSWITIFLKVLFPLPPYTCTRPLHASITSSQSNRNCYAWIDWNQMGKADVF